MFSLLLTLSLFFTFFAYCIDIIDISAAPARAALRGARYACCALCHWRAQSCYERGATAGKAWWRCTSRVGRQQRGGVEPAPPRVHNHDTHRFVFSDFRFLFSTNPFRRLRRYITARFHSRVLPVAHLLPSAA